MGFSSNFPDAKIINKLGDDSVYTRGMNDYAIKIILHHNIERIGNDGYVTAPHTEAEFLKGALGATFAPTRGDKITVDNVRYVVEGIAEDDGIYTRVIVIKH